MPPPRRPSEPENIARKACYDAASSRCRNGGARDREGGCCLSNSDMTWAMLAAFRELDRAGFDVVDRRTGKPVEFVDGNVQESF